MTPNQIATVTRSFQHLLLIEDTFAALFYGRLFTLDPALMPLFGTDMRAQGRKFTSMLNTIVVHIHDLPLFRRELHRHGQQHRAYGVRTEHYVTLGAALLWALQQALNPHYTAEVEEAWTALYHLVATTMQEAAAP